jgi:hypothetical protein
MKNRQVKVAIEAFSGENNGQEFVLLSCARLD